MNSSKMQAAPENSPWAKMLDEIERALTENLAAVDSRKLVRRYENETFEPPTYDTHGIKLHLDHLQQCLVRAERCAADADAELVARRDAVREWLTAVEGLQQRLATWESTSV